MGFVSATVEVTVHNGAVTSISDCPVGKNIHGVLDDKLWSIQVAMENEMKKYTIADVVDDIRRCLET